MQSQTALTLNFAKFPLDDTDLYLKLFRNGTRPQISEFIGNQFDGKIVSYRFGYLGRVLLAIATGKVADLNARGFPNTARIFQMRFHSTKNEKGQDGINFWPSRGEILPYQFETLDSPALRLNYKVKGNLPLIQKPYVDEIMAIASSSLYLGRLVYQIGHFRLPLLWFVLEKR